MDDSGSPVDWFVAMKTPRAFNGGTGYYYVDPKSNTTGWRSPSRSVMGPGGAIASTVGSIYKGTTNVGVLAWNDESPK